MLAAIISADSPLPPDLADILLGLREMRVCSHFNIEVIVASSIYSFSLFSTNMSWCAQRKIQDEENISS